MKLSEKIELVINILEQCKIDINWYESKRMDAEQQENNIRHEMEGFTTKDGRPPSYNERARLATLWQNTLLTRRIAKNNIMLNQPLNEFIESDIGKTTLNSLKQILGKTRKIEKEIENMVYIVRKTDSTPMNPVLQKNLDKMIRDFFKNKKR